ncbi:6-phosphogluconate dehydrogenase, decarboxylating [Brevibacterium sediminis]|uniref:6-phosphogluconate dehydrogenase, decarboxylating n=1 Tax=Brevibacterium sediminis TaxID=1857024 RepID=A0ABQ1MWF4_9MICO|nr:NADP-dependent phosphogluconate dehydrogenase [Brevibacterium sediminis]GGC48316.1 6-phosphogluconate dehydrogenase, decarboxylating [Brevibacterium sediminis]
MKADVAVIGTGVMGSNLARNLARESGRRVAVYDRDVERAQNLAQDFPEADFLVAADPTDLAGKLNQPRVAILMVNAGGATDAAIGDLAEAFAPGDIIVDGGNSHFRDTIARGTRLEGTGIEFAGVGISGGEVGALLGPSLMVGGSETAWQRLRPLLDPIAAKVGDEVCVDHIGTDGAGHFVKMVHNGIEYADMQLISEAFTLLRDGLGMTPPEIAEVFADWNTGELESYLIEITADVLDHVDEATGRPFVDIVADAAKAKGTGAWTAQVGLDLGVSVPTIAEAVFSRSLSSAVDLRAQGLRLAGPRPVAESSSLSPDERAARIEEIGEALLLGKVMAYVQGFHEIAVGAAEHGWDIDLGALAGIWRAGCIIRARLLDRIVEAFDVPTPPENLLAADFVREVADRCQESLRTTVVEAIGHGIAVPGLSSTLAYFDGLRTEAGSAALIQAQRDRFGSHTYARTDRPGTFHTLWSGDRGEVEV